MKHPQNQLLAPSSAVHAGTSVSILLWVGPSGVQGHSGPCFMATISGGELPGRVEPSSCSAVSFQSASGWAALCTLLLSYCGWCMCWRWPLTTSFVCLLMAFHTLPYVPSPSCLTTLYLQGDGRMCWCPVAPWQAGRAHAQPRQVARLLLTCSWCLGAGYRCGNRPRLQAGPRQLSLEAQ
jgi:hypothetical protein